MKKIGICFPENDFLTMDFDEFKEYILMFEKEGLYSFDMYTSLLIDDHKNIDRLLEFLNENDIKITFHYYNNKKDIDILDESKRIELLEQYKTDLTKLRHKLEAYDIKYLTTIVFHALNYQEEYQKYEHESQQIKLFRELCNIALDLNFDILVETLSYNHPSGNHLGDDYHELIKMIDEVSSSNFGICWDIGHTRLNHIEEYRDIYLPKQLLDKVKFTHIHGYSREDGFHEVIDHLPLTNNSYKDNEIKYLLDNNYDGIYSLEINTDALKENIDIYLKSINILKNMLEEE